MKKKNQNTQVVEEPIENNSLFHDLCILHYEEQIFGQNDIIKLRD